MDAARESARRSAAAGIPPDRVAMVVERALTIPRPRPRYLVGRDARIAAVVAGLPDRLRDRLVLAQAAGAPAGDEAGQVGGRSAPSA